MAEYAGAHHVHAMAEDDLPQILPAHYAEVVIIVMIVSVREVCFLNLQTHASTLTSTAWSRCLELSGGDIGAL